MLFIALGVGLFLAVLLLYAVSKFWERRHRKPSLVGGGENVE